LIGGWNLFCVSLGIKKFILKSIGWKIILNSHWFLKDEEAFIGRKDFQTSIGQGKQAQGEVMGSLQKEEWYLVCFLLGKKKENECVRKKISSYV
jgi:hypothetical protein